MEFLNIGGGELLVIVLLAIILFGPEDILKIMRSVGNYTRKIQRMWAQMSAGLKGEFIPEDIIPEEVRETITQTKTSVDDVKTTLEEVQTTIKADIAESQTTVKEVKETLREVDTSVKSDMREIPKAIRTTAKEAIAPRQPAAAAANEPGPETVRRITALLKSTDRDAGNQTKTSTDVLDADGSAPSTGPVAAPLSAEEVVPQSQSFALEAEEASGEAASDELPPVAAVTTSEPDPKTVQLIATLLEPKSKTADDERLSETQPTLKNSAMSATEDLDAMGMPPDEAETTSGLSPEPVTLDIADDEEM